MPSSAGPASGKYTGFGSEDINRLGYNQKDRFNAPYDPYTKGQSAPTQQAYVPGQDTAPKTLFDKKPDLSSESDSESVDSDDSDEKAKRKRRKQKKAKLAAAQKAAQPAPIAAPVTAAPLAQPVPVATAPV